jgi:UDP-N-acetyl-D-glucosamine dehydrogenase
MRTHEAAAAKFEHRSPIGVVGLGYVGLPLCVTITMAGFCTLGFDLDAERVACINRSEPVLHHISTELMALAIRRGFKATADFDRLREPDVIIVCAPTPLGAARQPDLSLLRSAAKAIAARLRKGQLVVIESTSYPGTTSEVVRPILEATGLRCGSDFFLAFSPERVDPGFPVEAMSRIPKLVGADDPESLRLAINFYDQLVTKTIPVSSSKVAEAAKLTENAFRAVNVALINELKAVYSAMAIDIWEVIEAAETKPFGYMAFHPGPGVGGHCIPVDPLYLSWKARKHDVRARLIELASEINGQMPSYVVHRLAAALKMKLGKSIRGAQILVLGIAYKANVDDIRESPSLTLIDLLERRGASCDYHDPFVAKIPVTAAHNRLVGRRSVSIDNAFRYDAVVIVADHEMVDYNAVVSDAKLVVDTRNACERAGIRSDKVVKA